MGYAAKPKPVGILDPTRMYSTEALRKIGIGRGLLTDARRAGVKPHDVNGACWYEGGDIIEWIKTKPRKGVQAAQ